MRSGEKGFTLVELVVVIAITAVVSAAAGGAILQVFKGTDGNTDHIAAVRQLENAGHWMSRDAQRAQTVTTDNLTPPDFLMLTWTEWDADYQNPVYHSARYFFDNLSGGIGKLKRSYWSSVGANQQTLIATRIYYAPADVDDTSKASYQRPLLTLRLTALFGQTMETKEYQIKHRPNL